MCHNCNHEGCDCKKKNCFCKKIAKVLVIIGGLNWGLVGIGMLLGKNWNLVNAIFGSMPTVEAIIYVLVGLAAIVLFFRCFCKKCSGKCEGGVCASAPEQKMPENM